MWSFSPPGGLLSHRLTHALEGFVTSVVLGKDVVPRISLVTIEELRDDMVWPSSNHFGAQISHVY